MFHMVDSVDLIFPLLSNVEDEFFNGETYQECGPPSYKLVYNPI